MASLLRIDRTLVRRPAFHVCVGLQSLGRSAVAGARRAANERDLVARMRRVTPRVSSMVEGCDDKRFVMK